MAGIKFDCELYDGEDSTSVTADIQTRNLNDDSSRIDNSISNFMNLTSIILQSLNFPIELCTKVDVKMGKMALFMNGSYLDDGFFGNDYNRS